MGAALLSTPELLLDILRALLDSIPLPISCKIRLLPTQPSTLYLASRILRTGVRNLTVHCRTRQMRPGERALWERLSSIVELGKRRGISVICNGDGEGWSNWDRIRNETGMCASCAYSTFSQQSLSKELIVYRRRLGDAREVRWTKPLCISSFRSLEHSYRHYSETARS